MTIEVKNCTDCPFVIFNEITGYDGCQISKEIKEGYVMPGIGVHELCPLKVRNCTVKLSQNK